MYLFYSMKYNNYKIEENFSIKLSLMEKLSIVEMQ